MRRGLLFVVVTACLLAGSVTQAAENPRKAFVTEWKGRTVKLKQKLITVYAMGPGWGGPSVHKLGVVAASPDIGPHFRTRLWAQSPCGYEWIGDRDLDRFVSKVRACTATTTALGPGLLGMVASPNQQTVGHPEVMEIPAGTVMRVTEVIPAHKYYNAPQHVLIQLKGGEFKDEETEFLIWFESKVSQEFKERGAIEGIMLEYFEVVAEPKKR